MRLKQRQRQSQVNLKVGCWNLCEDCDRVLRCPVSGVRSVAWAGADAAPQVPRPPSPPLRFYAEVPESRDQKTEGRTEVLS